MWSVSSRPLSSRKEVNSISARCKGVKSPPKTARSRSYFGTGSKRLTRPSTTVPAGITSRSNAYTFSSNFASTGAFKRFGTRFVRYRRRGTPEGTLRGIVCDGSVPVIWATALVVSANRVTARDFPVMIPLTTRRAQAGTQRCENRVDDPSRSNGSGARSSLREKERGEGSRPNKNYCTFMFVHEACRTPAKETIELMIGFVFLVLDRGPWPGISSHHGISRWLNSAWQGDASARIFEPSQATSLKWDIEWWQTAAPTNKYCDSLPSNDASAKLLAFGL